MHPPARVGRVGKPVRVVPEIVRAMKVGAEKDDLRRAHQLRHLQPQDAAAYTGLEMLYPLHTLDSIAAELSSCELHRLRVLVPPACIVRCHRLGPWRKLIRAIDRDHAKMANGIRHGLRHARAGAKDCEQHYFRRIQLRTSHTVSLMAA